MRFSLPRDRQALVRLGKRLNYTTIVYNSLEGILAFAAGVLAGSVALVGFGLDSLIELSAGVTALWRLRADLDPVRRERAEQRSLRIIGVSFLALAAYVAVDAAGALLAGRAPERSWLGIVIAAVSLITMPLLAHAKKSVALALDSGALAAEANQTLICTYLSGLLLLGLALHVVAHWWWADPVAALAMVPFIAREGIRGVQGRSVCGDDCGPIQGGAA